MSQSTCRQITAVFVVMTILSNVAAAELREANCRPLAKLVLKEAAFTGGLIVHVDCGDGRLAAALKQEDHTVVHGLTRNAANLEAARSRLQARRFDGSVSVELCNATTMPYADNLVNLLLVEAGTQLWSREGDPLPNFLFFFGPLDIFVARDLVWGLADGLELIKRPGSGHLLGLDQRSGQIRQRIPLSGTFTTDHHVRCYKGKATENFLLFNKRGIEFIPLDREQPPVPNSYQWVRGTCRYGILPCNGLIYAPPHACACYPGAKVDGFVALAAKGGRRDRAVGLKSLSVY